MATEESKSDSIVARIRENPGPAARWGAVMGVLVAVEFGAIWGGIMALPWDVPINALAGILPASIGGALKGFTSVFADVGRWLADVPTLLDRELIPNQGYNHPERGWVGPFMGLEPAYAWLIRVALVYVYAFVFAYWSWRGYFVFRRHYRYADWTPADDMIDRFRGHNWGKFGLVLVLLLVTLAVFAPTVSPTTAEQNLKNPASNYVEYWDEQNQELGNVSVTTANLYSSSKGVTQNFGIWSYDNYDRFHPAGTMSQASNGKDLFTFMAYGARVSIFIGVFAAIVAGGIALSLALLTAYYRGLVDLVAVLTSDAFQAMPQLLVLIMLVTVLADHWISSIYSGGFLIALLFGMWGWMGLWRAVRGPAFQIVQNEWVMASQGFGERPWNIVKKHVAPYVVGYLLIYLSMSVGGYMIGAASLSYLGLGVEAPTPEMGRAIARGQSLITTQSWHISVVPGLAITVLVLGFNALGDGIRDAIDPKSGGDEAAGEAAAAGGGG